MYKLDPAKRHLIDEFRARPRGPHGPELTQLVNRLRMGPVKDRYVLVCTKPHREWVLAQLPGERGGMMKVHWQNRFADLDAAEWFVFALRWKELTGEPPP
jgi:hypothetical protein